MCDNRRVRVWWFGALNFLIFTSVFLGRVVRDTLLFTSGSEDKLFSLDPSGPQLFPLILFVNAFVMTWFAGHLSGWWEQLGSRRFISVAFGGSAFTLALAGLALEERWPIWITGAFYLISEIPIFLAMNVIWILAADYFSEQDSRREFPRIAGLGMFGISLGSGIVLANAAVGPLLTETRLLYVWAGLTAGVGGVALAILIRLRPLWDEEEPLASSETVSFVEQVTGDLRWARRNHYLKLFSLVTACNFLLLAIFDQTLANGASHLGVSGEKLATRLGWFVFGFGLLAAFFQLFCFPKLLAKLGTARLNLCAPGLMLLGALVYLLMASDYLGPAYMSFGLINPFTGSLLEILIVVRICGWSAEFLFNQTLLPFIYGALPVEEMNRGRLFVEGPVTAITNGAVGLFLLVYFAIFQDKGESYGYKLDLLFLLALLAGIFMFIWSRRMVPEFRKTLLERFASGDDLEQLTQMYRGDFQADQEALAEVVRSGGIDPVQGPQRVAVLVASLGSEAVPELVRIVCDDHAVGVTRAAAWRGLVEVSAVVAFRDACTKMNKHQAPPGAEELQAMAEGAIRLGHVAELVPLFRRWLEAAQGAALAQLLRTMSTLGFDGAWEAGELVRRRLARPGDLDRASLLHIATELGSDRFYADIARGVRAESGDWVCVDWVSLGRVRFLSHAHALDAFALLLPEADDPGHPATEGLVTLVNRHQWLVWPLLWLMEQTRKSTPENLRPGRYVWPLVLGRLDSYEWPLSTFQLFAELKERIGAESSDGDPCAPELAELDWSQFSEEVASKHFATSTGVSPMVSLPELFSARLGNPNRYGSEVGSYLACVSVLFSSQPVKGEKWKDERSESELAVAYAFTQDRYREHAALAALFNNRHSMARSWLERRMRQWLKTHVLVWLCQHPETRPTFEEFPAEGLAEKLLVPDALARDHSLSVLEQAGLPRGEFLQLRSDVENIWPALEGGRDTIPYLPAELRRPRDAAEAHALWEQEVRPGLEDDLLRELFPTDQPAGVNHDHVADPFPTA